MADLDLTKNFGYHINLLKNQLKNFVLWICTTSEAASRLVREGMMAYDTEEHAPVVYDGTEVRTLMYTTSKTGQEFTGEPDVQKYEITNFKPSRVMVFVDYQLQPVDLEGTEITIKQPIYGGENILVINVVL